MAEDFGLESQLTRVKIYKTFVGWHIFKLSFLVRLYTCVWHEQQQKAAISSPSRAPCGCLPPFVLYLQSTNTASSWPSLNSETRLTGAIKASDSMPAYDYAVLQRFEPAQPPVAAPQTYTLKRWWKMNRLVASIRREEWSDQMGIGQGKQTKSC